MTGSGPNGRKTISLLLFSAFSLSPSKGPLWHSQPASFGMPCGSYRVEGLGNRNSLYMSRHVSLSLLNVKMADDGTKLCMLRSADSLQLVRTEGISGSSERHWKGVTTAVEGRWPSYAWSTERVAADCNGTVQFLSRVIRCFT